ncbi:hypothetical protein PV08_09142 [Exophiala spinifera]|uniref:Major facilitator superfamily (MFS) profile domain-containing protein n=1 Tax=Exophiala spinifera TaxID=91928 RepID=A0A0D2BKU9_9EURO|nr:uncharacterized protein PV08_09142 [Exophiala spinifera]KIW11869.1 hypothetical protein PV08_09142 [Exophiala spinifera]
MAPDQTDPKNPTPTQGLTSSANTNKAEDGIVQSATALPEIDSDHLHVVDRGGEKGLRDTDSSQNDIIGYDPQLMRARAILTVDEETKVLRRVDWRLLPLLAIMYVVKNVDTSNVSNARIMDRGTPQNIMTELGISANEYNWVVTAYYIPYILAEAPSNLVLKKMRPSVFQARIMVSWGIVLCCHAAVQNGAGLYTVRAFLGLAEAGMWPAAILQLCYWYRPDEIAPRVVLVTLLGNFATIISGILAFAFNGVYARGLSGWKWLVLTEGMFTVLLGIVVYFLLPDFPNTAPWLSDKEKAFLQARLPRAAPRAIEENFNWNEFITTLKDKRIWMFLFVWGFYTVGTTGLGFYQPTVVANLGFTGIAKSQLLNIPSAVLSTALSLFFGFVSSTGRIPQPLIPLSYSIVLLALYGVLYAFPSTGGVYTATILAGAISTSWYTMIWPWRVQTTSGATGSAFALAFANSYGQIGGAVGAHLFNSRFAPRYTTSFGIAMGFIGGSILADLVAWKFTWRVDVETRRLKRARIAAAKENKTVLEDVDLHLEKGKPL